MWARIALDSDDRLISHLRLRPQFD